MKGDLTEENLTQMVERVTAPPGVERWRERGALPGRSSLTPRALNLAIGVVLLLILAISVPLLLTGSSHHVTPPASTASPHP